MAEGFRSGVFAVPAGVDEFDVTGLSLPFEPESAHVSVRQPAADADIVSAYIAGEVTQDGFHVILSSPCTEDGYYLDFTVYARGGAPTPVSEVSLAVSYTVLKEKVAYFLGYSPASLSDAQAARIDDIIQSGLRRYYYPPMMDGVDPDFEWSFLRQAGTLVTTASVGVYEMPDGFNRIAGQLVYSGEESGSRSVPVIPYGDIRRMTESNAGSTGKPRFAAVAATREFGECGMKSRIYLYPVPDREYTLSYRCDADQFRLSPENPYPLGGTMFAELITESCLASAEQSVNDEIGLHTQNFNSLLASSIRRDRKSGAQSYGKIGDPRHRRLW